MENLSNDDSEIKQFKDRLEFFEKIANTATDSIIITNQWNKILFFNRSAEKIFGYKEDEVLGLDIAILMPEKYRKGHTKGVKRYLTSGNTKIIGKTIEIEGLRKDGRIFPIELSVSTWKEKDQFYFSGIIRDITKRKKEAKQIELLMSITEAINNTEGFLSALKVTVEKICKELEWNYGEAWLPMESSKQLQYAPVWYCSDDKLLAFVEESKRVSISKGQGMPGRAMEGNIEWRPDIGIGNVVFSRYEIARKVGLKTGLGVPILSDGKIIATILFYKYETEEVDEHQKNIVLTIASQLGSVLRKKQSEEQLKEREHFIKKIADSTPVIIQVYDRINNRSLYSNKELPQVLGYTPEEINAMGNSVGKIIVHPDDFPLLIERNNNLDDARDDEIVESEMRVKNSNNEWRSLFTRTTVFKRTTDGKVSESLSISLDTTDKKVAEKKLLSAQQELLKLNNELEKKVIERTSALENSQQQLNLIINALPDLISYIDKKYVYQYMNQAYETWFGKEAKDAIGKSMPEVLGEQAFEKLKPHADKALSGHFASFESLIDYESGARHINAKYIPDTDRLGNVRGMIVMVSDITTNIQTQESLKLQSRVLESMDEGVSVSDENGIIIFTNAAEDRIFGYERGELIGKHVTVQNAYKPEENLKIVNDVINNLRKNGVWSGIWNNVKKDGTPFLTYSHLTKLNVGDRNLFICVQHDITESERIKEALKSKAEDLNFLADAMPQIVFTFEASGKLIYINRQWIEYTGLSYEDSLDNWLAPIHPDDIPLVSKNFEYCKQNACSFEMEYRIREKNRTYRWNLGRSVPMKDKNGKVIKWIGTATDINERKQFEIAISESEERFRTIADEAPAYIFLAGENSNVEFLNKTWLTYTGMSLEEARGRTFLEVTHPDDLELLEKKYTDSFTNQKPYVVEIRQKGIDGKYRWIFWKGIPRYLPNGQFVGMMGIGIDIDERKNAENALKESEERFRVMADNISQLAWMANGDGWVSWYNKRWYDYTGTDMEGMQGWGWEKVHHPNYIERVLDVVKLAWAKGEAFEMEFPLRRHDGAYRWFLTRAVPVKDSEGKVIRWFGTNTDIEDQKSAIENLAKANEALRKTNNDLDNFIYTASHDLKAPITNIEGLMQALEKNIGPEIREQEIIKKLNFMIHKSIDRFKATLIDLTEITKLQKESQEGPSFVNLMEVVEDVKMDLNQQIADVRAVLNMSLDNCPQIRFSKKNLKSIVYNLLSNAIKYRSPERNLQITITCEDLSEYIILTVKDNGLGFKKNSETKIFSMFKRLHNHVEGSGIGLYIVKKILDDADGKIEVESEVDKGSIFRVYIRKYIESNRVNEI